MCGIAGVLTADQDVARRALAVMNQAQLHRGPDDGGEAFFRVGERWLGLGCRRLAIIDRSAAGHQPMARDGSCIVYNGEAYALNRPQLRRELEGQGAHFQGRSDTEVLLALLERRGSDAVRDLDGMFAFAYYSARTQTLMLARDAAGIKPLYVAQYGNDFLFASEVQAILNTGLVPRRLDRAGLAGFLAYGSVQEPHTLTADVRSLTPGTLLELDLAAGKEREQRFWRMPAPASNDAAAHIRSTLEREVGAHLVSDVPIGVFLSSGLDSTVVAGLAARARIVACTVSVDADDEAPLAARTAALLGAEHRAVRLSAAEAAECARLWLARMDQPSIDGLNTFIIARAAREAGLVVALSGQGGDELFGGYPSFREVPALARQLAFASWLPRPLKRATARALAFGRTHVAREKALDLASGTAELRSVYLGRRRLHSNRQMEELGVTDGAEHHFVDALPDECLGDEVATIARLELSTYLRSTLLRDADVASMASSLELRTPFLSRPVLDLMLSIPGATLLPPGKPPKHLERVAFADLLRPELLAREKRGFVLPMSEWMRGPLRDACEEGLSALGRADLLTPGGIDRVWGAFEREPDSPAWARAWALVVLGHFLASGRC
jgi:asparagine synthase (glutamine-hydrolysing)